MIIATSILSTAAFGQTLEEAIKKTDNERFDAASADFRALIAKEPAKADNYFYFGENLLKQGETDSAYLLWQKSASVDALSPIGMVGNGKYLWYSGDTAAARKAFVGACNATKSKNAEVMRQIGATYTYAPVKNLNAAINTLNNAIKIDSKNTEGYLILGDALLMKNPTNGSPAIEQYNKALDLNPKSCKGIVRKAKLYQGANNFEEAEKLYKEATALDPSYAPAYRETAELYMLFKKYTKAIENWRKYMELNNSDEARYRFATALFSGKRYCEAIPELEQLHTNGYVKFYSRRMLAYSLYECNPDNKPELNKKGLEESDKFFQIAPNDKIIYLDYKYRALHQSKLGNDSLAILEYEKAMESDTSKKAELAGDVAKLYLKAKKYDKAIQAYELKQAGKPSNLSVNEHYELGRAYYFGPKNYALADSSYKQLNERSPDFALGYLWRARTNLKLDAGNVKWMAKPYYETYLDKLTADEKAAAGNKVFQIEAAKYLGDYYINSKEGKDLAKAKMYWKIVQDLDPADKQAKAFFASPAGK